ncbi:MAG TPA: phosphatidylserine/phosphatidylglycerophosphate/cardiolipin synthase family protein [Candidatus Dormibacteraeota bacterium]|nr:phosphatidylserine/phosphatidylglycerophosphate/cardiolipin synthase family protein [Candidatus Dormibacteraeota bacterium]
MYGPVRRLRLPLLLLALLAASCAPGRTPSPATLAIPPIPPIPAAPIVTGSDQLVPLPDGPTAFAAIVDGLRHARHSIDLELYEFQRLDLAAMLLDAHDRGVAVTAIKDPSERSSRTVWAELEQGGVRVVAFPVERLTIDHVKLLIIDGVQAIVGGINWGTHSPHNHDFDVLALGPVVGNLERVFRQDLALAGQAAVLPPPSADRQVQVLVTHPGEGIRAAALAAIDAARHSIDIEMFVLSDRLVLDALVSAAQRGVQLRALLDPTQPQNAATLALLQSAGGVVRFYLQAGDELLHAKLGIFDRQTVLFGSCNWSRSGFTRNHELDLLVPDATLARVFLSRLEQDWAASAP